MSDEKQSLQEKYAIEAVNKEIENLKHDLKYANKKNRSLIVKRFWLKCIKFCQIFSFNIVGSILITAIMLLIGATPFKYDTRNTYTYKQENFDSFGDHSVVSLLDDDFTYNFVVKIYGKWEVDKNGKYYRNIKTYQKHLYENESPEDFLNYSEEELEDYFNKNITIVVESKDGITEDEKNKGQYVEIQICYKDVTKKYVLRETKNQNEYLTLLYILIIAMTNVAGCLLYEINDGNLSYEFNRIDNNNRPVNTEYLKRELKRKKNSNDSNLK